MTDDGAFRVMVVRSTDTVRGICQAQGVRGSTASAFADLITATVLFRETMSPGLRVQGILQAADKKMTLVADSAAQGHTRGLMQKKVAEAPLKWGQGALLQMMRTLHNGSINQGIVAVPEGGGVTQAMMAYMKTSEQVDTMLAVGTVLDPAGDVRVAGGYMVQLLPEVGRGPLAIMAQRLEDFRSMDQYLTDDFCPEKFRDELLYRMPFTVLDQSSLSFSCWCSEDRLLGALSTLNRSEIVQMVEQGNPLEITCDYCHRDYAIRPAKLQGLIDTN